LTCLSDSTLPSVLAIKAFRPRRVWSREFIETFTAVSDLLLAYSFIFDANNRAWGDMSTVGHFWIIKTLQNVMDTLAIAE
jgi:hypothetical protein